MRKLLWAALLCIGVNFAGAQELTGGEQGSVSNEANVGREEMVESDESQTAVDVEEDTNESEVEAEYSAGPNDPGAVRIILDKNDMAARPIDEVATFKAGRVIKLNLDNRDIATKGITVLPSEIGNLTQLEVLSISDNDIVELPKSIGNCRKLRKLFIKSNSLVSLPSTIGNLMELRVLDLRNNELSSLPMEIGLLGKLWKLQLWGNNLRSLPETIGSLKSLNELYLRGNRLKTFPMSVMKLDLDYIDLQDNRLCNPPDAIDNWLKKFDEKYRSWQKCW